MCQEVLKIAAYKTKNITTPPSYLTIYCYQFKNRCKGIHHISPQIHQSTKTTLFKFLSCNNLQNPSGLDFIYSTMPLDIHIDQFLESPCFVLAAQFATGNVTFIMLRPIISKNINQETKLYAAQVNIFYNASTMVLVAHPSKLLLPHHK